MDATHRPFTFCGLRLKAQCYTIGVVRATTTFCLIIFAIKSIAVRQPAAADPDEIGGPFYDVRLPAATNSLKLLAGSVATFAAAICLVLGLMKNQRSLMLVWLAVEAFDVMAILLSFAVFIMTPHFQLNPAKVFAVICYVLSSLYFQYSVYFYYAASKADVCSLDGEPERQTPADAEQPDPWRQTQPRQLDSLSCDSDDDVFILAETPHIRPDWLR